MKTLMNDQNIAARICDLDKFANGANVEQIEYIKNMLFRALDSRFETQSDKCKYVFEDADPLCRPITDGIEEGDALFDAVRDIQHDIASFD